MTTLLAWGPPEVQRPRGAAGSPAIPEAPAEAPAETPTEAPTETPAEAPAQAPVEAPTAVEEPAATQPTPPTAKRGETFHVAEGNVGKPPYYTAQDIDALRRRHGLPAMAAPETRKVRWHCLIADPLCGFNVEVQAMGAFAARLRQGDVREKSARKWSSGRAQYDVWVNLPVLVETRGTTRYTRMTLGPKAGAIFSDTGDTWGNLGLVGRYWLGRGRFAPAIEFSSALAFKLARRPTNDLGGAQPKYEMQRGPVGVTGDVGLSIGGFASLVIGGQYDSPLAREDVPEKFRTQAAGMFFVGLRGNILWGAPAAAAVVTHGLTQRYAKEAR
ncbi:MAG: hypothetical protein K1X88_00610 [Nannocystaceae bacterium]|nr:hypothetical protein [Nannocystaceae bacterium]